MSYGYLWPGDRDRKLNCLRESLSAVIETFRVFERCYEIGIPDTVKYIAAAMNEPPQCETFANGVANEPGPLYTIMFI